jgi:hypothetical protein
MKETHELMRSTCFSCLCACVRARARVRLAVYIPVAVCAMPCVKWCGVLIDCVVANFGNAGSLRLHAEISVFYLAHLLVVTKISQSIITGKRCRFATYLMTFSQFLTFRIVEFWICKCK